MNRQQGTASQSERLGLRGPLVLMAAITATELAMLNIIFWARAQGTYPGLVLAIVWPWAAAILLPLAWSHLGKTQRPTFALGRYPRLATGIGVALTVAVLIARLVTVA